MTAVIDRAVTESFNKIHANYKTFWPYNEAWGKILRKVNWKIIDSKIQYLMLDQLIKLKIESWISSFNLPQNTRVISLDSDKHTYLTEWIKHSSWLQEMPQDVQPTKASALLTKM